MKRKQIIRFSVSMFYNILILFSIYRLLSPKNEFLATLMILHLWLRFISAYCNNILCMNCCSFFWKLSNPTVFPKINVYSLTSDFWLEALVSIICFFICWKEQSAITITTISKIKKNIKTTLPNKNFFRLTVFEIF